MSGSSTINQRGSYDTEGGPSHPGARSSPLAWSDNTNGLLWLFGGYGYSIATSGKFVGDGS